MHYPDGSGRMLSVHVTAADTGLPIAGTNVAVVYDKGDSVSPPRRRIASTDKDGRISIAMPNAARWWFSDRSVGALSGSRAIDRPFAGFAACQCRHRHASRQTRSRPSGERRYGRSDAVRPSSFWPREDNLQSGKTEIAAGKLLIGARPTDADGRFFIAVPDVPGVLTVTASDANFLPVALDPDISKGMLFAAHAVLPVPNNSEVTVGLKQGRSIEGKALLPDGTPVLEGFALCYHSVGGRDLQSYRPFRIRNGRFVVPGCQRGFTYTIVFTDETQRHGAVGRLTCPTDQGQEADVVRLQPTASATLKFVDAFDEPVTGIVPSIELCLPPSEKAGGKSGALLHRNSAGIRWLLVDRGRTVACR